MIPEMPRDPNLPFEAQWILSSPWRVQTAKRAVRGPSSKKEYAKSGEIPASLIPNSPERYAYQERIRQEFCLA
jgi:hypothetical protein